MFGLREAGLLGASAVVAGGVAYLIWNYASSAGHTSTPEAGEEGGGAGRREAEEREGERAREEREEEDGGKEAKEEEKREEEVGGVSGEEGVRREEEEAVMVSAAPAPTAAQAPAPAPAETRTAGTQVLVLGLDGAGKTSLLHCLSSGSLEQDMQPTQGFNAVSIHREELHIEFLEIGGKADLRQYWQMYLPRALLLVFVVDSARPELFPVARQHLHQLLTSDPGLPLMVLANKQDLPGACGITDVHEALALSELGHRPLFLIGTHVVRGEAELSSGVQDAKDLISQMVSESR